MISMMNALYTFQRNTTLTPPPNPPTLPPVRASNTTTRRHQRSINGDATEHDVNTPPDVVTPPCVKGSPRSNARANPKERKRNPFCL